jgi:hypothetical protein
MKNIILKSVKPSKNSFLFSFKNIFNYFSYRFFLKLLQCFFRHFCMQLYLFSYVKRLNRSEVMLPFHDDQLTTIGDYIDEILKDL